MCLDHQCLRMFPVELSQVSSQSPLGLCHLQGHLPLHAPLTVQECLLRTLLVYKYGVVIAYQSRSKRTLSSAIKQASNGSSAPTPLSDKVYNKDIDNNYIFTVKGQITWR